MPLTSTPSIDVAKLNAILNDPRLEGSVVSATVADSAGNLLFTRAESTRIQPASNQKLLTCAFALSTLGPDYRPQTRFWKRGDDVWVDSPGDPSMSAQELSALKMKLAVSGRGTVRVREAYRPGIPPTWEWDDLPSDYAATVTAFSVDRGAFELWDLHGNPVFRPKNYGVRVHRVEEPRAANAAPSMAPSGAPGGASTPIQYAYDPVRRQLTITGPLPKKSMRIDSLAVPAPDEAAASLLGSQFETVDEVPHGAPELVVTGHSTAELLGECLPPSDNNLAENLLLMATARLHALPVDPYPVCEHELTRFLVSVVGVSPTDVHVVDGCGMSRQDYVTTRGLARLLVWADHQKTASLWKSVLASPVRGTLNGRLTGLAFVGKTGTLGMVSTLSGYLRRPDGTELIVSIAMNASVAPNRTMHEIQDAFVRALVGPKPISGKT